MTLTQKLLEGVPIERSLARLVDSVVEKLKVSGYDVDYEWDPHNTHEPLVRFYAFDADREAFASEVRDWLPGWHVEDQSENQETATVMAKPKLSESFGELLKVGGHEGVNGTEWLQNFLGPSYKVSETQNELRIEPPAQAFREFIVKARGDDLLVKAYGHGPNSGRRELFRPSIGRLWKIGRWIRSGGQRS